MLVIKKYDRERNHRFLVHEANVFHKALFWVQHGERVFHVKNPMGENYNLEYVENQKWAEASEKYPDSPLFRQEPLYPPYLFYDENDKGRLCFDILDGVKSVWFEEANEYSVVLTGILLKFTSLEVYSPDPRLLWFCPDSERLFIREEVPPEKAHSVLRVVKDFQPSAFTEDFSTMDQVVLFHHIFVYQWLTNLPFDQVKYAEIVVARSEGIGSILTMYARACSFFARFGFIVTLQPGSSRYSDSIIKKYFNIRLTPEDADETNTICIPNYYGLLFTRMLRESSGNDFDISTLNPSFVSEMKEYGKAVLKDKRMLGILLRGSDYIASGMSGVSAPVNAETSIPKIREWMAEDGYDGIFLATEDNDILKDMLRAFPGKITVVSQERYSIEDFRDAGVTTISELDRVRHVGEEYDAFVEDSLVNYFYALYLLSRCESFMYSGQCGGIVMAKSLCEKGFRRMWCFAENKEIF